MLRAPQMQISRPVLVRLVQKEDRPPPLDLARRALRPRVPRHHDEGGEAVGLGRVGVEVVQAVVVDEEASRGVGLGERLGDGGRGEQ